jgi:hypothetical protein
MGTPLLATNRDGESQIVAHGHRRGAARLRLRVKRRELLSGAASLCQAGSLTHVQIRRRLCLRNMAL